MTALRSVGPEGGMVACIAPLFNGRLEAVNIEVVRTWLARWDEAQEAATTATGLREVADC